MAVLSNDSFALSRIATRTEVAGEYHMLLLAKRGTSRVNLVGH